MRLHESSILIKLKLGQYAKFSNTRMFGESSSRLLAPNLTEDPKSAKEQIQSLLWLADILRLTLKSICLGPLKQSFRYRNVDHPSFKYLISIFP